MPASNAAVHILLASPSVRKACSRSMNSESKPAFKAKATIWVLVDILIPNALQSLLAAKQVCRLFENDAMTKQVN